MKVNLQVAPLGAIVLALFLGSISTFAVDHAVPVGSAEYGEGVQHSIQAKELTHDGTLVSVSDDTLTLAEADQKQHTFTLPMKAKLTLDGKVCTKQDLKVGTRIRVTTNASDKMSATFVEAIAKNEMFANTHQGQLVSVMGNKLMMKDKQGKEHSHLLSDDAKITLDGKICQAQDLKAGMDIRVSTNRTDAKVANCVEAIDKDGKFAQVR